jgi:hypothetical protein
MFYPMPKVHKRKYEKIDDAEIDLVIQCNDSHEFYDRYREVFPTKKKGIESISNIWKRRSEFMKKHKPVETRIEPAASSPRDLDTLIELQARNMAELSALVKEHILVSKEILEVLKKQNKKKVARAPKIKSPETQETLLPEQKPVAEKPIAKKPAALIIGS